MTVRVILVSPALRAVSSEARFDGGEGSEGQDDEAVRSVVRFAGSLPAADRQLCGPSRLCRATADALGLRARTEPALGDWDMGRWRGRRLDEVSTEEPDAVAQWLTVAGAAPHGGESLLDLCGRAGAWLEGLSGEGGRVVAVAGPAVVRAVVVRALALPAEAFWRLDVVPLTATELSGRSGRWNLRCGSPLAS
ncbi:histidine phosphatase family protein [Streptomyces sp. NBC_01465]|uniref:histidine phosphatase family protein n=1 Tax=Streptomyces sp. NBC_01465 TaxID=2903878 RepID=UPI002E374ADD|nr:histidine phosphatase family protein [Streptomyces sp. NBC_01465]